MCDINFIPRDTVITIGEIRIVITDDSDSVLVSIGRRDLEQIEYCKEEAPSSVLCVRVNK